MMEERVCYAFGEVIGFSGYGSGEGRGLAL